MFRVIDSVILETISFKKKIDAQKEAERRLAIHQNGYSIRRNYIAPVRCHLEIKGDDFIICLD